VTGILLLSYLVSQQAATFFIGLYCSVEDVGFYTLAFKIASMVGLLSTAFGYVLLPVIAEQFGKGETEKMKQIYISSLRYLMVVTLPLAAGGIALADSIIILFYGADYQPAVLLLQLVSLPIAFSSINVGDLFIRAINRPSFILKTLVVFSVVNIGLCLWLIPRYGILGATIASSVPLVLTLPVHVIYISKRVGIGWPMRDTIKISVASVIMGIAVYVLHTHLSTVLSIALCIPLGVVIYFAAIFALRVIKEEDLVIIRKVQESLPQVLRKYYTPFVGLMEKVVGRTKLATDP
jgi:O-antigen/teichoic acid export membrane protein